MFKLNKINISGAEVLPIIEGGKGINVSSGLTAGHFAKAGAVGTFSGTNADYYDENNNLVRYYYDPKLTRREKFEKLVEYSIKGALAQAKIANDVAGGQGRIHMNLLWEAGGTKRILEEVLSKIKELGLIVHGVTCGAGLPYSLSDIALAHRVHYYPIVSSARAFKILWKRSYQKASAWLGGVVYEDPWLAGGHNGLSNQENPVVPQDPYPRIVELRTTLNEFNMSHVPIIIAGGVWKIKEWEGYLDNKDIGLVAFQFGTRPILTQESPIPAAWKQLLLTLREGDISLHKFSPTGFYSSAINNQFLQNLKAINERQMFASRKQEGNFTREIASGNGVTVLYVTEEDYSRAMDYIQQGYDILLRTPDKSVIFVNKANAQQIKADQIACMGCLSACRFSGWAENEEGSTGIAPDPRSFCIQKTLQDISHDGRVDDNLLFSGHYAYRFAQDDYYKNGHIPTIAELVDLISKGE
ncbi:Nitronate monooxygenase [Candidatus Hepatincolaceae symbiont of Richtersius coronifer]